MFFNCVKYINYCLGMMLCLYLVVYMWILVFYIYVNCIFIFNMDIFFIKFISIFGLK